MVMKENEITMIKVIAEKNPSFLTKSTEEKLIVIRHQQLIA